MGDMRHIEIGLIDKTDAVAWVLRECAVPTGINPRDILLAGDAFGSVAGIPGSDPAMLLPELREATVILVGPEPGGTPPNVLYLGGGPARFRDLLAGLFCAAAASSVLWLSETRKAMKRALGSPSHR